MRVGSNPQKQMSNLLDHKRHRVILPFWIPNVTDEYFKNQPKVLHWCLKSLTETIDPYQTNITLINNNSCAEAADVASEFVKKGLIDKYVVRSENRGKLENVLAEARASYEDFITISDADFLFFPGWENEVSDIYKAYNGAGMVSCFPVAHLSYSYNSNMLFYLKRKGKVVADDDIDEFESSIGHTPESGLYNKKGIKKGSTWRDQQYYLKNAEKTVVLGAVHALATFRREVVNGFNPDKVPYVFKSGYEHDFVDYAVERQGYIRVSSARNYAYHMGNTIPPNVIQKYNDRNPVIESAIKWPSLKSGFGNLLVRVSQPVIRLSFRAMRKFKLV